MSKRQSTKYLIVGVDSMGPYWIHTFTHLNRNQAESRLLSLAQARKVMASRKRIFEGQMTQTEKKIVEVMHGMAKRQVTKEEGKKELVRLKRYKKDLVKEFEGIRMMKMVEC